jgi:cytochrome c peroxidase
MRRAAWLLVLALATAAGATVDTTAGTAAGKAAGRAGRQARIELGRRLFYDADLSRDGTMACATCHEQHHAFAEGNATHAGVTDEPGRRNVPSLANVGHFRPLTWADPRQRTLAGQVSVPVLGTHPVEMGMTGQESEIARRLSADPCYRLMFARAFAGGAVTYAHAARAIAAFEATLVSRTSPWDRGQLSAGERAGEQAFARHCAACHAGRDFTDLRFHAVGAPDPHDAGLYEVTGKPADKGAFRTPSLRNLAVTAPYWHNGTARTLPEAIARHALALTPQDTQAILAFLAALDDPAFRADPALALPRQACGKSL